MAGGSVLIWFFGFIGRCAKGLWAVILKPRSGIGIYIHPIIQRNQFYPLMSRKRQKFMVVFHYVVHLRQILDALFAIYRVHLCPKHKQIKHASVCFRKIRPENWLKQQVLIMHRGFFSVLRDKVAVNEQAREKECFGNSKLAHDIDGGAESEILKPWLGMENRFMAVAENCPKAEIRFLVEKERRPSTTDLAKVANIIVSVLYWISKAHQKMSGKTRIHGVSDVIRWARFDVGKAFSNGFFHCGLQMRSIKSGWLLTLNGERILLSNL